jgi:hypothetical protein
MKTFSCVFAAVLVIVVAATISSAQPPDSLWARTYGGPLADDASSFVQTADGGYVLAGYTYSFGAGNEDFWLLKTNANGDSVWSRTFGGPGWEGANSLQQTSDGGFILAGFSNSFGVGGYNLWLVKTDANGNSSWSRSFSGPGWDGANCVLQTADGGYILGGLTNSYGAGDFDFWLLKTNANGDSLWSRTFGGPLYEDIFSIQPTTGGGYILAGRTLSYGASNYDAYLVKTNANGDSVWTRHFGGSGFETATAVQQTTDGGYILAGITSSYGAGNEDFWLLKTNASGDSAWSRTFGGASWDRAYSLQKTADGGYILAGRTDSYGSGQGDFYLVKTNSNGNSLWSRTFGGAGFDGAYFVRQTTDSGFVLAGFTESFGAGGRDFWLVKTRPEYPNVGYVTLISPGPPDWGYRLHWVSGSLSRLVFTNFCSGTTGSVGGNAEGVGWTVANYSDSVVFTTSTPLTAGSIETFWLSHPSCAAQVIWTAGDSSGSVDGPLPVELLGISVAAMLDGIELQWNTASETDNDFFEIMRGTSETGAFNRIATLPSQGNSATGHHYEYLDREVTAGQTYWYYLADVDLNGNRTEHRELMRSVTMTALAELPSDYSLSAYPNPFNPSTTISFALPEADVARIAVYDVAGRWIQTLMNEKRGAGNHTVMFDARDLPSGVYFARMESGQFTMTKKMLLIR